jgi:hypothetical protein
MEALQCRQHSPDAIDDKWRQEHDAYDSDNYYKENNEGILQHTLAAPGRSLATPYP